MPTTAQGAQETNSPKRRFVSYFLHCQIGTFVSLDHSPMPAYGIFAYYSRGAGTLRLYMSLLFPPCAHIVNLISKNALPQRIFPPCKKGGSFVVLIFCPSLSPLFLFPSFSPPDFHLLLFRLLLSSPKGFLIFLLQQKNTWKPCKLSFVFQSFQVQNRQLFPGREKRAPIP